MGTFFLNILIGIVALAAFYNIYKGRNPIKGANQQTRKEAATGSREVWVG
jgi:hypothetical protein